ncbi:MAG TPA: hypothetical protein PKA41_13905 [Verrucomicrobiota bacterium]|nr:hypothetical protein [Verrucomicrobiota bacterium]
MVFMLFCGFLCDVDCFISRLRDTGIKKPVLANAARFFEPKMPTVSFPMTVVFEPVATTGIGCVSPPPLYAVDPELIPGIFSGLHPGSRLPVYRHRTAVDSVCMLRGVCRMRAHPGAFPTDRQPDARTSTGFLVRW